MVTQAERLARLRREADIGNALAQVSYCIDKALAPELNGLAAEMADESAKDATVALIHMLKHNGVMLCTMPTLIAECEDIVARAVADLGPDFGGMGSVFDLCCDNVEAGAYWIDIRAAVLMSHKIPAMVSPRVRTLLV